MSINGILKHMEETSDVLYKATPLLNEKEREYAEHLFFDKMMKDVNVGMSDLKVRGRIQQAVSIAKMLYKEIYGDPQDVQVQED